MLEYFPTFSGPLGVQENVYTLRSIAVVTANFNDDAVAGNTFDYTLGIVADVAAGIQVRGNLPKAGMRFCALDYSWMV